MLVRRNRSLVHWPTAAAPERSLARTLAHAPDSSAGGPAGCTTSLDYDEDDRLTKLEDSEGYATYFSYDEEGRLHTQYTKGFGTTTYTYPAPYSVTVQDPKGRTSSYVCDAHENLLEYTDPLGYSETKQWSNDHLTSSTDRLDRTTSYQYDDQTDLLTSMTTPAGVTESYEYDANRHRTAVTNFRGYATYYGYDDAGSLLWQKDALENVTYHDYDASGQLIGTTDARGNTTYHIYDENMLKVRQENALGHSRYFVYDTLDRQIKVVDERGNPAPPRGRHRQREAL